MLLGGLAPSASGAPPGPEASSNANEILAILRRDLFKDEIVARVNRDVITRQEIEEEIGPALRTLGNPTPEAVAQIVYQELFRLVREKIQDEAARRYSFFVQKREVLHEIEERRKEAGSEEAFRSELTARGLTLAEFEQTVEKQIARSHFLKTLLGMRQPRRVEQRPRHDIEVGPEEQKEFYASNRESFRVPTRARVRRLYVSNETAGGVPQARSLIQQALDRVRAGEDFGEVARACSHDKTREEGGDLGWIQEGDTRHAPEIVQFALTGHGGETSEIQKVPWGFFLLHIDEKVDGVVRPLDEVQNEIQRLLWNRRAEEVYQTIERELIEEAYIDPPELKQALLARLGDLR